MDYSSQLLPFVISALVVAGLLVVALRHWREPAAPWFTGTLVCLLVWTVAYIAELSAVSLGDKLAWADVQFFAILPQAVFWFLAVRAIVGAPRLPRLVTAALWLACAFLLVVVLVNPAQTFRGAPSLAVAGSLSVLAADYGIAYFALLVPFQFGLLAAALVVLVRSARHTHGVFRQRALILVVATALPVVVGALYAADLLPWSDYDPATAIITISAVLCAYALWRYRLFDLAPLARAAVIEHLTDAVLVLDVRGRVVDFNPAASLVVPELTQRSLGLPVEQVLARAPEVLARLGDLGPGDLTARPELVADRAGPPLAGTADEEDGEDVVTVPARAASGGAQEDGRRYSLSLAPVLSPVGERVGTALVLHDVTRLMQLLRQVQRLAGTDELTDLLSRRRFFGLAEREVERARRHCLPLSVLVFDLDDFKLVNDVYGHAAGDDLLRAMAATCREQLRPFDIVGRVGGDEFCALLPHDGPEEGEKVAERLRAAVAGLTVVVSGSLVRTTLSIGVASSEGVTDETVAGLLEAADAALYEAKRAGRDCVRVGRRP